MALNEWNLNSFPFFFQPFLLLLVPLAVSHPSSFLPYWDPSTPLPVEGPKHRTHPLSDPYLRILTDFHAHFFARPFFDALAQQSPLPGSPDDKLAAAAEKVIFEYNTVEGVLLSSAVLICLFGVMLDSEYLADGKNVYTRDCVTGLTIFVIATSLTYFAAVLWHELVVPIFPSLKCKCLSVCADQTMREDSDDEITKIEKVQAAARAKKAAAAGVAEANAQLGESLKRTAYCKLGSCLAMVGGASALMRTFFQWRLTAAAMGASAPPSCLPRPL